jgi:hypothetical protein
MEIAAERAERQRQREQEEAMRQEANRHFKEGIRANVDATKRNFEDKVRRDVDYFKQEKRDQKDFMQVQKHQEQIKNH